MSMTPFVLAMYATGELMSMPCKPLFVYCRDFFVATLKANQSLHGGLCKFAC